MTGFEPATPGPPDQYATGLRHIPNSVYKYSGWIRVLKKKQEIMTFSIELIIHFIDSLPFEQNKS